MSIQQGPGDRRYVQAEVEVPGTPEEVWEAIATGRGISSWFVPTRVDEFVGGESVCSFGPGMDSVSKVTAWDPPKLLAAESNDLGPDAPPIATEWIVEAREGGTCIVRVVHSLFTTSTDWDSSMEAWEGGWPDFFRILSLYLNNFRGQFGELVQLSAMTALAPADAWAKLCSAMGAVDLAQGDQAKIQLAGSAELPVSVERVGAGEGVHAQELLVRVEGEQMPGLAHGFALQMGEQTCVSLRFYVYGEEPRKFAAAVQDEWSAWLAGLFPATA